MEKEDQREDIGEEQEEEELCPVCFSEFDLCLHPPSTLPCGHTFCRPCLLHPSLASRGQIHCPLCRRLSRVPHALHRSTHTTCTRQPGSERRQRTPPIVPPAHADSLSAFAHGAHTSVTSEFAHRPLSHFPSHPLGVSVVSEGWLEGRCALCCRPLLSGPFPLHCGHNVCRRCLALLLAVASPGWVSFLYCPQCQGQTAVVRGDSSLDASPNSDHPSPTSTSSLSTSSPLLPPTSDNAPPPTSPRPSCPAREDSDPGQGGNRGCGFGIGALCGLL